MARVVFAPESGRFYTKQAEPILEVENKSKPGETRPPTITDCVKSGWLPSVTEIIKIASSPGLEAWKLDHLLDTVLRFPFMERPDTDVDDLEKWPPGIRDKADSWKSMVSEKAKEYASTAAERGKEIHKGIEQFFLTGVLPADPAAEHAAKSIAQFNAGATKIIPSYQFANLSKGYAGEMDLLIIDSDTPQTATQARVQDIKTKDISKFAKPTIDYGYQLGGYSQHIVDTLPNIQSVKLDEIIVDRDTGETLFFTWGEKWKRTQSQNQQQLSHAFLCLLGVWVTATGYNPCQL